LLPRDVGREREVRALREAKAHAALNARLSNRRQRASGSELCPLGHLRHHRGSYLAGGQRFEERQGMRRTKSSMLLCIQLVKSQPTGDVASVKQADDGVPVHDGQRIPF